ncbi:MAG: HAMP domain-containing histidine kinase, partial [Pseudomonadales bacterium]|nr:HAMP domain-containing histidine kinase [Pseudomonadales bacterium]
QQPSTRDIPVIFVTGLTQQEDIKAGFDVGGVDYICKPVQSLEVLARIRAHLGMRKMYQSQNYMINNLELMLNESSEHLSRTESQLRAPLNAIVEIGRAIRADATNQQHTRLLSQINTLLLAGDHLTGVFNNMLDIAKSDSGLLQLTTAQFDIVPLINNVESMSTSFAKSNNNKLVFECNDVEQVYGDEDRLQQILLNLTNNACKFTQNGTVKVVTSCDYGFCEIVVEDNGIGITDEDQDCIFQPTKQNRSASNGSFGGAGLGLAISYRLAKLMDGELEVESTIGVGSRFILTIPTTSDSQLTH